MQDDRLQKLEMMVENLADGLNCLRTSLLANMTTPECQAMPARRTTNQQAHQSDQRHQQSPIDQLLDFEERESVHSSQPTTPPPPRRHQPSQTPNTISFTSTIAPWNTLSTIAPPPARPALTPRDFDGHTSWTQYRLHFESIAAANGWHLELKSVYLPAFLRGTALTFFEMLDKSVQKDFTRLCAEMDKRFSADHEKHLAHLQLRCRVQKSDERLADFATDLQRLTNIAFSDCPENAKNRIALAQFVDGISDVEIQHRVREAAPSTIDSALQHALQIQASFIATRMARRAVRAATTTVGFPELGVENLTGNE